MNTNTVRIQTTNTGYRFKRFFSDNPIEYPIKYSPKCALNISNLQIAGF